ncbi:1-deoxy-D-xylulose 5-phosphate reductoisomerase [Hydrogenivirga caldilitoris]|uniref:1-deoxy-D-xylulose 5-phosphate reductoisomerase n=1 Tax=Hydrogenivirga caldilitoris TaxID=246264 RepID=A0A497XTI4_9AQUI|nr:1-deoxy-D-xylulose-5-phosphate reductoisomerase [Hydrogenivirga caldilitoris]RLJ71480.1 1-deoxy-D-xylulose 5-phosphate reductoisomerase [Hydrogenivirga caldilitoris]
MIKLAVLGSTGSVGTQTLEVAEKFPEEIEVKALLARRASDTLLLQTRKFKPELVVTYEEPSKDWLSSLPKGTQHMLGDEGLHAAVALSDRVMNAVSGVNGIKPAHVVLKSGKLLLASNKESIICLGELVKENRERVIPVDSEHNALFQLLRDIDVKDIRFVYLTASGGPFKDWSLEEMSKATKEQALRHPRWNMGAKITIDSATLMNKGFELLEAMNLFCLDMDRIKVVIHPQSVVHGVVELKDGSFFMHASQTDMKIPIMHALFYPERKTYPFERKPLPELSPVSFEEVDTDKFRALYLARWAGEMGGVYIPVLLGADEEAVELFLEGRIGFLKIVEIIEKTLSEVNISDPRSIDEILAAVEWGRAKVRDIYEREYAGVV